ncbi:hypothetical protein ACPA9J_25365 [Pseudomonas aeruginosa]
MKDSRSRSCLPDGQNPAGQDLPTRAARLLAGHGEIVTVTNREHYFQSKDQFHAARLGRHRGHFILEPTGRNTLRRLPSPPWRCKPDMAPRPVLVVMPADHLIRNEEAFREAVGQCRASRRRRAPGYLRRGAGRSGNRFRLYRGWATGWTSGGGQGAPLRRETR